MQSLGPAQLEAQALPLHWTYVPQLVSAGEVHVPAPSHTSCGLTTAAAPPLPGTHDGALPQVVPWAFGVQLVMLLAGEHDWQSLEGFVVPSVTHMPSTAQPVVGTCVHAPPWHCRLVQASPSSLMLKQLVPLPIGAPHAPVAG